MGMEADIWRMDEKRRFEDEMLPRGTEPHKQGNHRLICNARSGKLPPTSGIATSGPTKTSKKNICDGISRKCDTTNVPRLKGFNFNSCR